MKKVDVDGGYGWVIVFAAFMIHVIADGILYTLGVLYIEFLEEFKQGKGETAWINSLIPGTMLTIGPISGALTSRFGCRIVTIAGAAVVAVSFIISSFSTSIHHLYLSLGVASGVGFGGIFLPSLVCVGQYFEKKRSFAIGLAVCGAGVGTFAFAPLVRFLVDEYGWRGTTLIEAGIALNMAVCGTLFKPIQLPRQEVIILEEQKTTIKLTNVTDTDHFSNSEVYEMERIPPDNPVITRQTDSIRCCLLLQPIFRHFEFSLLTDLVFLIFIVSNVLTAIGFNVPYVYLPDRAEEKGISKTNSAFLISTIGITNTVGRIFFGWIADQKWANRLLMYGVSLLICGIVNVLNPLNDSYAYLIGYSAIHGLFIGVFVSLNAVLIADFIGIGKLEKGLGLLMMFHGIATYIGPPISGWLYDGTGSYNVSFFFVGSLFLSGAIVLILIPIYRHIVKRKHAEELDNKQTYEAVQQTE